MRYHEYEAIDDIRTAYEMLTSDGREEAQEEAIDRAPTADLIQGLVDKGLPPYMERLLITFFKRKEV